MIEFFPLIKRESIDERNFVKKTVSRALRHIVKKNKNQNIAALKLAYDIKEIDSQSARWIEPMLLKNWKVTPVQKRLIKFF